MNDGGSPGAAVIALDFDVGEGVDDELDEEVVEDNAVLHPSRLTMTPDLCAASGLNVDALAFVLSQQPLLLYENPSHVVAAAHLEQHSFGLLALTSP